MTRTEIRARKLAKIIVKADLFDFVLDECQELCKLAGLEQEWKESDGDTYERVVYKAAKILGVNI